MPRFPPRGSCCTADKRVGAGRRGRRGAGRGRRGGPLVAALPPAAAADRGRAARSGASRGRSRSAATAGACPHVRAGDDRRRLVRAGLLPRPGPALAARPLPALLQRPAGRDRRRGGPRRWTASCARSACGASALAEEAALEGELRAALEAYSAGVNAAAEAAAAPPAEFQLLRDRVRALAAGRHADADQAARARALDQLGARADPRRHGPRARRRAGGAARSRLSARATRSRSRPGVPWSGDGLGARRADRRRCARRSASRPRRPARTTGRCRRGARRPAARCWRATRT